MKHIAEHSAAIWLIDEFLSGRTAEELVEAFMTHASRTSRRPRKRRFSRRSSAVDPVTGKRKDPRRRRIARMASRKGRSKRKMSAKRFARSARGKMFHRKLGKLSARIRR